MFMRVRAKLKPYERLPPSFIMARRNDSTSSHKKLVIVCRLRQSGQCVRWCHAGLLRCDTYVQYAVGQGETGILQYPDIWACIRVSLYGHHRCVVVYRSPRQMLNVGLYLCGQRRVVDYAHSYTVAYRSVSGNDLSSRTGYGCHPDAHIKQQMCH